MEPYPTVPTPGNNPLQLWIRMKKKRPLRRPKGCEEHFLTYDWFDDATNSANYGFSDQLALGGNHLRFADYVSYQKNKEQRNHPTGDHGISDG